MLWWFSQKACTVADRYQDDTVLQVLGTCMWALQRCIEIQSMAGIILTRAEATESSQCLLTYNKCYGWLALKYQQDGYLFKVRPKNHYLEHMALNLMELQLNQNKLFTTNTEESFLGMIKSIACKVHGKTLVKRTFQRYCLCLAVSLRRLKEQFKTNDD